MYGLKMRIFIFLKLVGYITGRQSLPFLSLRRLDDFASLKLLLFQLVITHQIPLFPLLNIQLFECVIAGKSSVPCNYRAGDE